MSKFLGISGDYFVQSTAIFVSPPLPQIDLNFRRLSSCDTIAWHSFIRRAESRAEPNQNRFSLLTCHAGDENLRAASIALTLNTLEGGQNFWRRDLTFIKWLTKN